MGRCRQKGGDAINTGIFFFKAANLRGIRPGWFDVGKVAAGHAATKFPKRRLENMEVSLAKVRNYGSILSEVRKCGGFLAKVRKMWKFPK